MTLTFALLIVLSLCSMSKGDEFCDNMHEMKGVYLYKNNVRLLVKDKLYDTRNAYMTESSNGFHKQIADSRAWLHELVINGRAMPKDMQSEVPPNEQIKSIGQRIGLVQGVPAFLPIVQTTPNPSIILFVGNDEGSFQKIVPQGLHQYASKHRLISDYIFFRHTLSHAPVVTGLVPKKKLYMGYLEHLAKDDLFEEIQNGTNTNKYFWMVKQDNESKADLLTDQKQAMSAERLFKKRLPLGYRIPDTKQLEIFNTDDRIVYRLKEMNGVAGAEANLYPREGKVRQKFAIIHKEKFESYFGCPLPKPADNGSSGGEPQSQGIPDWLYYALIVGILLLCLLVVGAIAIYCCFTRGKLSQKLSSLSMSFAPRRGRRNMLSSGSEGTSKNSRRASKPKGDEFASLHRSVSSTNKGQSTGGHKDDSQSTATTSSAVKFNPTPHRKYKPKKKTGQTSKA